ncbi:hypothetical protein HDV05_008512 [Chytridiales sp. JEL 0842]|nr:hypothetical protein HDV05_008512 [Chytridiales sp. JEL 0842]
MLGNNRDAGSNSNAPQVDSSVALELPTANLLSGNVYIQPLDLMAGNEEQAAAHHPTHTNNNTIVKHESNPSTDGESYLKSNHTSSICHHNKRRSQCFDEGLRTNSLCEHRKIRTKCKDCTPVKPPTKKYRPRKRTGDSRSTSEGFDDEEEMQDASGAQCEGCGADEGVVIRKGRPMLCMDCLDGEIKHASKRAKTKSTTTNRRSSGYSATYSETPNRSAKGKAGARKTASPPKPAPEPVDKCAECGSEELNGAVQDTATGEIFCINCYDPKIMAMAPEESILANIGENLQIIGDSQNPSNTLTPPATHDIAVPPYPLQLPPSSSSQPYYVVYYANPNDPTQPPIPLPVVQPPQMLVSAPASPPTTPFPWTYLQQNAVAGQVLKDITTPAAQPLSATLEESSDDQDPISLLIMAAEGESKEEDSGVEADGAALAAVSV